MRTAPSGASLNEYNEQHQHQSIKKVLNTMLNQHFWGKQGANLMHILVGSKARKIVITIDEISIATWSVDKKIGKVINGKEIMPEMSDNLK